MLLKNISKIKSYFCSLLYIDFIINYKIKKIKNFSSKFQKLNEYNKQSILQYYFNDILKENEMGRSFDFGILLQPLMEDLFNSSSEKKRNSISSKYLKLIFFMLKRQDLEQSNEALSKQLLDDFSKLINEIMSQQKSKSQINKQTSEFINKLRKGNFSETDIKKILEMISQLNDQEINRSTADDKPADDKPADDKPADDKPADSKGADGEPDGKKPDDKGPDGKGADGKADGEEDDEEDDERPDGKGEDGEPDGEEDDEEDDERPDGEADVKGFYFKYTKDKSFLISKDSKYKYTNSFSEDNILEKKIYLYALWLECENPEPKIPGIKILDDNYILEKKEKRLNIFLNENKSNIHLFEIKNEFTLLFDKDIGINIDIKNFISIAFIIGTPNIKKEQVKTLETVNFTKNCPEKFYFSSEKDHQENPEPKRPGPGSGLLEQEPPKPPGPPTTPPKTPEPPEDLTHNDDEKEIIINKTGGSNAPYIFSIKNFNPLSKPKYLNRIFFEINYGNNFDLHFKFLNKKLESNYYYFINDDNKDDGYIHLSIILKQKNPIGFELFEINNESQSIFELAFQNKSKKYLSIETKDITPLDFSYFSEESPDIFKDPQKTQIREEMIDNKMKPVKPENIIFEEIQIN